MTNIIKVDLPYPELDLDEKSLYEVRLLKPVYGGAESETTAIMTYIYQNYVLAPDYEEIALTLEGISLAEMTHHDLLGTAIVQLGGTPVIGGNYNYWQGGMVNYSKDVRKIIDDNIAAERKAIRDYREVIARTKMDEIKALIERIILDEELHIKVLKEIRQNLRGKAN